MKVAELLAKAVLTSLESQSQATRSTAFQPMP